MLLGSSAVLKCRFYHQATKNMASLGPAFHLFIRLGGFSVLCRVPPPLSYHLTITSQTSFAFPNYPSLPSPTSWSACASPHPGSLAGGSLLQGGGRLRSQCPVTQDMPCACPLPSSFTFTSSSSLLSLPLKAYSLQLGLLFLPSSLLSHNAKVSF